MVRLFGGVKDDLENFNEENTLFPGGFMEMGTRARFTQCKFRNFDAEDDRNNERSVRTHFSETRPQV